MLLPLSSVLSNYNLNLFILNKQIFNRKYEIKYVVKVLSNLNRKNLARNLRVVSCVYDQNINKSNECIRYELRFTLEYVKRSDTPLAADSVGTAVGKVHMRYE